MILLALLACRAPAPPPPEVVAPTVDTEMRAVWVTRFTYTEEAQVRQAIQEIADAGFNTVFFQVRGSFDAWYDSDIEPWAAPLSGTLGQDPGWDPLAVAVEAGHARGLQVHAWLNSFPMWRGTEAPPEGLAVEHAWNAAPDWRLEGADGAPMALNAHYVFADPANPAVRARLAAVAADIGQRYAVDGIHLDYIRYPEAIADRVDGAAGRFHVTSAVRAVREATPLPLTAAVWGVYDNAWGWERVLEGRDDLHQDSHAWLAEGLVDAILPMVYFSVKEPGARLDFATLAADHVERAGDRPVVIGISAERLDTEALLGCVKVAREAGAAGVSLFDWSLGRAHFDALREGPLAEAAAAPRFKE